MVVVVVVEWLAQSALGQEVLGSIIAASKHFSVCCSMQIRCELSLKRMGVTKNNLSLATLLGLIGEIVTHSKLVSLQAAQLRFRLFNFHVISTVVTP